MRFQAQWCWAVLDAAPPEALQEGGLQPPSPGGCTSLGAARVSSGVPPHASAEACSPPCTPLSGIPGQPDSRVGSVGTGQHARPSPQGVVAGHVGRRCGGAQGSARIIGCFQRNREQLGFECKAALFDQEQQMAEDIDFLVPLKVPLPRCRSSRRAVPLVGCSGERDTERGGQALTWSASTEATQWGAPHGPAPLVAALPAVLCRSWAVLQTEL